MLPYLFTALALLAPNQAEFKTEQVSIMVDIQSNIFQYNVTNLSSSPIVHFEVHHHAAYNFQAPTDGTKKILLTDSARGLMNHSRPLAPAKPTNSPCVSAAEGQSLTKHPQKSDSYQAKQ